MRGLPPALVLMLGVLVGACMDATIKHVALTNHVLTVVFARYLIGALFSLIIWKQQGAPAITAEMWRVHGMRGFVIAGCASTFFWALTVLPLAEAVTLSFVYPLLVPFMAAAMLGERVRSASVGAALIGFVGIIIAAQGAPSAEESPLHAWGVAAVLVSAGLFAIAVILLRQRAQTDGPAIVSLMTSVVPGIILLIPTVIFATPPRLDDAPSFVLMGACAAVFMYLMAQAYARAEAQQLAPIHYTELIWASLLGYLVFQETPRLQIYLGAALIIAACLYSAYQDRRLTRRPT